MDSATQDFRGMSLGTVLGKDELLIEQVSGAEGLGELFNYRVQAVSEKDTLDFDKVMGSNATVRFEMGEKSRFLNGVVSQMAFLGHDSHGLARYELVLVPWLWLLTRTSDCRIFQEMSAIEIIKKIFNEAGLSDYRDDTKGSFQSREYCVQYGETDFNFVQRLMEHEGIYYYFKHENGKHTLVLCDDMAAHRPSAGFEKIYYRPEELGVEANPTIYSWASRGRVTSGAYVLNSFDFETPGPNATTRLLGKSKNAHRYPWGDAEMYVHENNYVDRGQGETWARIRREQAQAASRTFVAETGAPGLVAGCTFELTENPKADENQEYLISRTSLSAQGEGYAPGGGGGEANYRCAFEGVPKSSIYRPGATARQPRIPGPQTAIVTGPRGEEIHTDKYGRVTVQFIWDRYGKANEGSSCWIRVAQAWAGKQWGGFSLPRVGQEVVVEFLDGDPDRPIVTGRVYNGDCKPPYELPGNKTRTTFKTNSTPGGGGFNEIRIEDKKGKEQIFIHAEKDRDLRVKNDNKEIIQGEEHILVEKLRKEEVMKDNDLKIGGENKEEVAKDSHLTVGGSLNEKVGESQSLKVGQNLNQKAGMKIAQEAGMEVHIKGGMNVVIEAGAMITLKAGGGFITVGPTGVAISGTPVLINSGGAAGSGGGCQPTPPKKPTAPTEADKDKAGKVAKVRVAPEKPMTGKAPSATNVALKKAAQSGAPFCEVCNK